MTTLQKTEDARFARDKHSTAILNIDKAGYQQFKMERDRALQLQHAVEQVSVLQSEMRDIKQLLQQLVNGKTNG
jgi:hypothetical protein